MSNDCHITFWGTRGSIPTPGRLTEKYGGNTTCVVVRQGNTVIIFDAGSGIRPFGGSLAKELAKGSGIERLHLFFTHTHWDHIQGLPFFIPAFLDNVEINIYSSPDKAPLLKDILNGQMSFTYFPIEMSSFAAKLHYHSLPTEPMTLGEMSISWELHPFHPGGSVRYCVEVNNRKFIFATDAELDPLFADGRLSPEQKKERTDYLKFVEGAHVLVADGQYLNEDYIGKVGWGHSSMGAAIKVAEEAGVHRLALFHHEPAYSDSTLDRMQKETQQACAEKKSKLEAFWAREAMTIAL
ncbi:MAG: MBL fold metallo-hydrolase [Bdellovibrionales bacterium]|nr:MBL fold metallo-hydrolase [Bdellovibrionales bacterium]